MKELISFVIWLFYLRLCAYSGSKRILGGFNGIMFGVLFSFLGILFILSFRRLDDHKADAALLKEYNTL
jgi:hypothetical protein